MCVQCLLRREMPKQVEEVSIQQKKKVEEVSNMTCPGQ